jgi:hypothetical protein
VAPSAATTIALYNADGTTTSHTTWTNAAAGDKVSMQLTYESVS